MSAGHRWASAAGLAAAGLLFATLGGCARELVRTGPAAMEPGRGRLPGEQQAERATFALG